MISKLGMGERAVVLAEALGHLVGKIEPRLLRIALLESLHDTEALAVVIEAAVILHQAIEGFLSGVAERGMSEVVG